MPSDQRSGDRPVITSTANPHLKLMRSLVRRNARRAERAFLLEGRRLVEDAIDGGISIRHLLIREDVDASTLQRLGVPRDRIVTVAAPAFDASSDVEHAQGIAAIADLPMPAQPDTFRGDCVLVLDAVRDPGNLGTLLRSAAASGVRTVVVTPGTVDPFAPKVVRAGMGAHVRLSIGFWSPAWSETIMDRAMPVVHADAAAETRYDAWDWRQPWVLVIGGETAALSETLAPLLQSSVSIPMRAEVESLNAAVAGSVLLFEAARQRLRADADA